MPFGNVLFALAPVAMTIAGVMAAPPTSPRATDSLVSSTLWETFLEELDSDPYSPPLISSQAAIKHIVLL